MNKPLMRAFLIVGAICIIATSCVAFSIGKWFYEESRYYQQAEDILPVAYELSYRLTDYTETKQERLISREEIKQMVALPEFSRLSRFPFSITFDTGFMLTFSINKRFIIRIARFYPEQGSSFSPQLAHVPKT